MKFFIDICALSLICLAGIRQVQRMRLRRKTDESPRRSSFSERRQSWGLLSSATSTISPRIAALRVPRSRVLNVIIPRNLLPKLPGIPL